MSDQDFDVPKEPSVEAEDPNERKLARRLRVQRRLEALKKNEGTNDEGIVEKTLTEKQIETSVETLEKLATEGDEVITNVRVANDARELNRRDEDVAVRNVLLNNLEREAEESLAKFRSINAEWSEILGSKDPLDIHAGIQSQNFKCSEILNQKNLIIEQLKSELENSDEKFFSDQKKQSEDVNLLIERMDNQVNTITKAYRRELILIQEALDNERNVLLENVKKRWNDLYDQRRNDDANGVDRRKEIMNEYEKEMKRVRVDHQEKYRAEKIKLETECQNLQLQVQQMKAVCMMNVEKLDYSYAVLKRREDENSIIKSQQKRRINKLQDVVGSLKKNYNEMEESTRLEIEKLRDHVIKSHKNIKELEEKSNHFTKVNEKQYFDIWEMNTSNANQLLEKILTADRIIYEQTLGLDWEPPDLPLLTKEDLPSYNKTISEFQQKRAKAEAATKFFDPYEISTKLEDVNLERRLLNDILRQISDHSGFLIEDKLRELLARHTSADNVIIRLDNVFQALGIKTEDQIDALLNFFLPYAYCVICTTKEANGSIASDAPAEVSNEDTTTRNTSPCGSRRCEQSPDDKDNREENLSESVETERCDLDTGSSDERSMPSNDEAIVETAMNFESRTTSAPEKQSKDGRKSRRRSVVCEKGHLLKIDSADVTKALKEFVQRFNASERTGNRSSSEKFSDKGPTNLSRNLTTDDVENYWKRYRQIFSTKKEKLWDGLTIGLRKYHEILKERRKLSSENDCLREQNEELRRLLETYTINPGDTSLHVGPNRRTKLRERESIDDNF